VTGLARDHKILAAHYPQLRLDTITGSPSDASTKLSAINLGYYGRHLSQFYDLTFSEIGWLAQQDPYEFQGDPSDPAQLCIIHSGPDRDQISEWLSEIDQNLFGTGRAPDYPLPGR